MSAELPPTGSAYGGAVTSTFVESSLQEFRRLKRVSEKAIDQLTHEQLHVMVDPESNSVATIMKHMAGNMISRWTDFLTTDGEKLSRNRDSEFVDDLQSRDELLAVWERGWKCLFDAVSALSDEQLRQIVHIRREPLSVVQAVTRQVSHYAYHCGQIVFVAKHLAGSNWKTLSIPKGKSADYVPK